MLPLTAIAFELDEKTFAVALERIGEVALRVEIQALPGARLPLLGMVGHRGETIPILDLRARLGLEPRTPALSDHFLFLETRQGRVGVEVDRVLDVIHIDPSTLVAPPQSSPLVAGLAIDGQGTTYIADPDAVFAYEERKDFEAALARMRESA